MKTKKPAGTILNNDRGMVLVVVLLLLSALIILGTTAVMQTSTDLKISGNYKTSTQAFYVGEAGISEALYRLGLFDDGGTVAPPSGSMISVNNLDSNNAAINIDPNGLLSNGADDDGNGATDDISDLNYNGTYDNRDWQAKIMLSTSAPAGLVSNITFFTNTIQSSGSWLEYSSSTDDGTVLTIEYKKDANDMDGDSNTDEIVFYDGSLANPYNVETAATSATGQPVVVITSTGKSGGSTKTIQVEATYQPVDIDAEGAVMVDLTPDLLGSAIISGFNHDGSTTSADENTGSPPKWAPVDTFKTNGVDNHGGAEDFFYYTPTKTKCTSPDINVALVNDDVNPSPNNEEELEEETLIPYGQKLKSSGGHKPGVWTTKTGVSPNADVFGGDGITPWKAESAAAWKTLVDLLGITQDQLDAILANANVTESDMGVSGQLTAAPQGVIYINNNGGNELQITTSTPSNSDGWGLMYITGDANFQNLEFKGLIYVEGDAQITGTFWSMGCLAVKGTTSGDFSAGNGTFLYSKDALEKYGNKGMKFVILSWKDV